jgi:16S rRNA (adenine1518-N6/adenine1519-N6)-dimethyltransferase
MRLNEIKEVLTTQGLRLTKSLGQNFLHDANQLRRIVQAAELSPRERVLEIGPGLGALTERLVAEAGHVLAIEKDARLFEILQKRSSQWTGRGGRLELLQADALEYLRRERRDWSEWKLVANLPYSVASPLLVELALAEYGPARMVVTVQMEVARRLMAAAGQPDYGLLTLLVQLNYPPGNWFKLPAGSFFPAPAVDSACVCLERRAPAAWPRELAQSFALIVKRSFSQRRKMMLKLLKTDWPGDALDRAFAQCSLPAQVRAEEVSLPQFIRLTRLLASPSEDG